ncbi:shikimate dehydrogenase [Luedemannella helvata]|uniref:shikimate dehydrogenase family protein n=1 Tax=Luedemannella helvata TaxID=349315 RepID=UPI0031DFAF8E
MLGKPIAHSLSPVIHNAGYAAAGLTGWHYAAHEVAEDELAAFVAAAGPEWAGMSLTMPLKEVALAVADEVGPLAAAIGAANTLVRRTAGGWRAENTDAPGMVAALRAAGAPTADHDAIPGAGGTGTAAGREAILSAGGTGTAGGRVAILGAGGTARAAVAAARELGAAEVTAHARRPEAVADLEALGKELGVAVVGAPWPTAEDTLGVGEADAVISTVPKGVADPLAPAIRWGAGTVLFDAIYDPWPTPLAAAAQAAGVRIVSGLDLLLAQAVGQFELFTGVTAPVAAMGEALFAAAARR